MLARESEVEAKEAELGAMGDTAAILSDCGGGGAQGASRSENGAYDECVGSAGKGGETNGH
eukprot:6285267-Alexandrium_andersonii.AAC.1